MRERLSEVLDDLRFLRSPLVTAAEELAQMGQVLPLTANEQTMWNTSVQLLEQVGVDGLSTPLGPGRAIHADGEERAGLPRSVHRALARIELCGRAAIRRTGAGAQG